ncbi:MAG: hypothetical protein NTW30_02655 [Candidatus Aenigmarchaeota archaeon]|nr:hypothetical protein [Candidatus Aenigmarchaeota archaeon]
MSVLIDMLPQKLRQILYKVFPERVEGVVEDKTECLDGFFTLLTLSTAAENVVFKIAGRDNTYVVTRHGHFMGKDYTDIPPHKKDPVELHVNKHLRLGIMSYPKPDDKQQDPYNTQKRAWLLGVVMPVNRSYCLDKSYITDK